MRVRWFKEAVWLGPLVLTIAVAVIVTTENPPLGLGLLAGAAYVMCCFKSPSLAGAAWLLAIVTVPQWWTIGIPGVGDVGLTLLLGVALALSILISGFGRSKADLYVLGFAVLIVASLVLATLVTPLQAGIVRDFLLVWIVPAFIGARLAPSLRKILPVAGALVGAWSIIEIASGIHLFETIGQLSSWQAIQYRGGLGRSEAAFGTPLALGAFLALSLPFVLYMRNSAGRVVATALITGGILATVSRSPLIALLITGVLLAYRYASLKSVTMTAIAALAIAVVVGPVFNSGEASADAAGSDAYRTNALMNAIWTLRPIGLAEGAFPDPITGSLRFAGFNSIDSAVLLTALVIGWVPVILAILAMLPVLFAVVLRQSNPEEISLVGQFVMLATLALITGWQLAFFVLVGIVMSARAHSSRPGSAALSEWRYRSAVRAAPSQSKNVPVTMGPFAS